MHRKPNPDLKVVTACLRCGKEFEWYKSESRPRKYCSLECYHDSVTSQCAYCGQEFRTSKSGLARGKGKYCSQECRGLAKKAIPPVKSYKQCEYCGKTFAHSRRRFCSPDCSRRRFTGTCLVCGKEFVSSSTRDGKYCSTACYRKSPGWVENLKAKSLEKWRDEGFRQRVKEGVQTSPHAWKRRVSGENHPLWKGGHHERTQNMAYKVWRKAVLARDQYQCQHCGSKDMLHVHHIKSYKEYPELRYVVDNGLVLCETCHNTVHGRKSRSSKTCAYCGNEFKPPNRRQRCCSRECANALRRTRRLDKTDAEDY